MDSKGAKTADESSAPAALWRRGADLWDVKGHVDRPAKRVPVVEEVDVLVAGGGITGIIAALAAGRLGARTLVVEPFGSLGGNMGPGMFAGGSLHLALKNPEAFPDGLGGIPQEFNERVVDHEERRVGSDYLRDSKTVPYVATRMLEEAGVDILLFSAVVDVVKEGDRLTGILVENKSGTLAIRSRVAVDCTGTADVADRAGAPVVELEENPSMGVYFGIMGVDAERWARARDNCPALSADDEAWLEEHQVPPQLMPWARQAWEAGDFRIVQVVDGFATLEITLMEPKGDPPSVNFRTRVNGRFHPGDGLALSRIQQQQWCFIYEFVEFMNRYVPGYEDAYLYVVSPYFQARGGKSIESERALTMEDVAAGDPLRRRDLHLLRRQAFRGGRRRRPLPHADPKRGGRPHRLRAQRHEARTPVPPALQRPADGSGRRHGGGLGRPQGRLPPRHGRPPPAGDAAGRPAPHRPAGAAAATRPHPAGFRAGGLT